MEQNIFFSDYKRIHFIGIGGVSMSGLAKFCLINGFSVSGSDKSLSEETKKLSALGAKIFKGHRARNAYRSELVVYSSAVPSDNPELKYAVKNGIPVLKRSELLGEILSLHGKTVAISGSHGKTTTTAMLAETFIKAGLNPTVFLGGVSKTFGNFRSGAKDFAVAEACEYRRNFLDIKPDFAVILNIDNDHVDTYKDKEDAANAFSRFAEKGFRFVNADDPYARKIFNSSTVTFGIKNLACYTAKYIDKKECRSFTAYAYGKRLGRVKLKISGEHNVYNALAAIAVANELRLPFSAVKSAIEAFDGVKRRNEYLGSFRGVPCYADYAHHPTEIAALLNDKTVKTLAVFQPHTYSRTAALKDEFVSALSLADGIIIYKTYPAREKFNKAGDGKTLYIKIRESGIKDLDYADTLKALKGELKSRATNYGKIIFIGAGDIYSIAKSVIDNQ